ncbi:hypothetical protein B4U80_13744 [Leptotrombidium deliense]|uniref:MSP domain-containing protein n=1 Tax=Leptotrombidium deliense TaxID=299467 RepID=A0A443SH60_9ACAR|nr:hypothetical protein B4U80_13744 [Leptotrombidium deliense]
MSVDEPKQESNYSQTLAEVSPRGFLAFPSKDVRGMCASKTFISIRNISKYHITYKVSARQQLRARPRQHVLAPGSRQTVEIVIDSEYIPKIEDKLYVKIYQNDSENIVNGKTEEVCFCLYETSKLALIPMQEEVFNLQQRLESMEVDVCTLQFGAEFEIMEKV